MEQTYLTRNKLKLIAAVGRRLGHTFKCSKLFTNDVTAIKILTIPENKKHNGFPHRILNHVSILKMLNHPNIVRLQTMMETEEEVFIVFEYLACLRKYLTNQMLYDIQNREKKMLCLCPNSRISADQALEYPYLRARPPMMIDEAPVFTT